MSDLHESKNEPPPRVTIGNVKPADVSSNQPQPLPWVCGEGFVPLQVVGQIYDQFTRDAPAEVPGKKGE